ncbi:MAG: hypothetical protein LCH38_01300 [Proteobacteria bacterium]|nr:hypothetical protein [Pseudomonadota bacterium]
MPARAPLVLAPILRRNSAWFSGFALAIAIVELAGAQPSSSSQDNSGPATTLPDCYCRANGRIYGMGAEICLAVSGQASLFRCEMDQNVTSWKRLDRTCPQS